MEKIPESYYKAFLKNCYFIHYITMMKPTDSTLGVATYLESDPVPLKVNINLN
jgi:hypothetical protein